MTLFAIYDKEEKCRYIIRSYKTLEIADAELEELLLAYPPGHYWRNRLEVGVWAPKAKVARSVSATVPLPQSTFMSRVTYLKKVLKAGEVESLRKAVDFLLEKGASEDYCYRLAKDNNPLTREAWEDMLSYGAAT